MLKPSDPGFIEGFDWGLYPVAEKFLQKEIKNFLKNHNFAKSLSNEMINETSTKLFDWIDYMALPESRVKDRLLKKLEFDEVDSNDLPDGTRLFKHTKTEFFPVLITKGKISEIGLKPEHLEHFLQIIGKGTAIEGEPFAAFRKAEVKREGNYLLSAVERRGYNGFIPKDYKDMEEYTKFLDIFFCRKRFFNIDKEGMRATEKLVEKATRKLKSERVADAFFR